jgi:Ulp1 family protease
VQIINAVKNRLKVLHEKQNIAWNPHTWKLSHCDVDAPRQYNGFDCAIFVMMAIDFLSIDLPLMYDGVDVARWRWIVAYALLENTILI